MAAGWGKSGAWRTMHPSPQISVNSLSIQYQHICCGINQLKKAIQITIDRDLLEDLDRNPKVRIDGRSAVIRQAVQEYLARAKAASIAKQYAAGYSVTKGLTDEEIAWWVDEGAWSNE